MASERTVAADQAAPTGGTPRVIRRLSELMRRYSFSFALLAFAGAADPECDTGVRQLRLE